MKRRNRIALGVFIVISALLPKGIELLYELGKVCLIIPTVYTANEVLTYTASIIGLVISMYALFVSQESQEPHFMISFAETNYEKGTCMLIQLRNDSPFDYKVSDFGICDKKHRAFFSLIKDGNFTIMSKSNYEIKVPFQTMREGVESVTDNSGVRKAQLVVKLSFNSNANQE